MFPSDGLLLSSGVVGFVFPPGIVGFVGSVVPPGFVPGLSPAAFPVVAVASSDGFFPSTVAVAFTVSPSFGSLPSGTFAVKFPSLSAVVSTFVPSGSSTTTFAFGSALPLISLSPAFGAVISGFAVASCAASFQTA